MIKIILSKLYHKLFFYKNGLRIFKLKVLGAQIGHGTISYGRFSIINIPNLIIGTNSTINEGVHINCRDKVKIGNNVHISSNVQIHTGKLIIDVFPRVHEKQPILIENDVWLASNVVVLAGVTIGEKSIIAAGSIVTKDVPANSLAMGIPARVVKKI
jgi:acetyltransferase-like isoleucine patch superfamily enzyme